MAVLRDTVAAMVSSVASRAASALSLLDVALPVVPLFPRDLHRLTP
ncbi:hypothetical protein [Lentzea tibetensis]